MDKLLHFFLTLPWWGYVIVFILLVGIRDIFLNKKHAISHNFPVIGHLRYFLEQIGPELRQYIVASNREELPFNRNQRSWVYASSKKENNFQGFGSDHDQLSLNYTFIKPSLFPYRPPEGHFHYIEKSVIPCAKVIGQYHQRKRPFRPYSIVNISAMSFGSLSANAITTLNKGALKAGCYHNTGEGSLSPYHTHGADIVLQIGTGYFGVRDDKGNFVLRKLVELVEKCPFIRAIEIKLSQGAKPGEGGILPAAKISKEIAAVRQVPRGKDVFSPPGHTAFGNVAEMIDFIEKIAATTGLPVGIKSAVGRLELWEELTTLMQKKDKGPDFITIDGGEGGTGAAPPAFANYVSLPFIYAFPNVYQLFAAKQLTERTVFIGAGKLGFPYSALMAFAMGVDLMNVAREAMLAIGCIQAQRCHTNQCPAGVATQNKWLQAGLNPTLKSERFCNYIQTLNTQILQITHACGYEHPSQMTMEDVQVNTGTDKLSKSLKEIYQYDKTPVAFKDTKEVVTCPHLGGLADSSLD